MPVESLSKLKLEKIQRYTTRDLFDLVFTDYKDYPSELAKIPNLETYAKRQIAQIVNAIGLQPVSTLQEFFLVVNEVAEEIATTGGVTTEQISTFIDSAGAVAADTGVSFGGGG
jgi:hypothetical protein